MCTIQIRLAEQHRAAEFAYRSGINSNEGNMWPSVRARLATRGKSEGLSRTRRQVLQEHEQEHLCGMQESFAAITIATSNFRFRQSCSARDLLMHGGSRPRATQTEPH
jgi:hypothetical protein